MRTALLMALLASPAFAQDFREKLGQDVSRTMEAYNDGYRRSAREDEARRLRNDLDSIDQQNRQIIQQNQEIIQRQMWGR